MSNLPNHLPFKGDTDLGRIVTAVTGSGGSLPYGEVRRFVSYVAGYHRKFPGWTGTVLGWDASGEFIRISESMPASSEVVAELAPYVLLLGVYESKKKAAVDVSRRDGTEVIVYGQVPFSVWSTESQADYIKAKLKERSLRGRTGRRLAAALVADRHFGHLIEPSDKAEIEKVKRSLAGL